MRPVLAAVGRTLGAWRRWPYAGRSAARVGVLALAAGLYVDAWRGWTVLALLGLLLVLVAAVVTGPACLGWWRPRELTDAETYAPSLWVAVRQLLRVPEDQEREKWLTLTDSLEGDDARVTVRLPIEWLGTDEQQAALRGVMESRLPGEWEVVRWNLLGGNHWMQMRRKRKPKPKPQMPNSFGVPWQRSDDQYRIHVGKVRDGDEIVDVWVDVESATPHWGVAGGTGAGKSTVLYIPVVHGRQHGWLVDLLDPKQNSMKEANDHSGIRTHVTMSSCAAALAEFLISMIAAETAKRNGLPPGTQKPIPRLLVIDELPSLIMLLSIWWQYGLKKTGKPPFLSWFIMALLQGRSADHRLVVGTQQFAREFFGGTMGRDQLGTRIVIGEQEPSSWVVAFGQGAPVIDYDTSVKGRGAYASKGSNFSDTDRVREFQPPYITPEVDRLLSACAEAPAWFDEGEMAPWITPEVLARMMEEAACEDFLPGGKHGPVTLVTGAAHTGGAPSSEAVTRLSEAPSVTGSVTGPRVPAQARQEAPAAPDTAEELPDVYTLPQACKLGILPYKESSIRTIKKRSKMKGADFPEGMEVAGVTYYTEAELTDWLNRWQAA